jgi:hypothetical protein
MFYDVLQVVKFGFYVTGEALQSEVTGLTYMEEGCGLS